jgi:hypothetical protein
MLCLCFWTCRLPHSALPRSRWTAALQGRYLALASRHHGRAALGALVNTENTDAGTDLRTQPRLRVPACPAA